MRIEVTGHIPVTGDCGHKFDVPIARMEDDFTCPECGRVDRFSTEQVAGIKSQVRKAAGEFGVEEIREGLDKTLRDATRGSKHLRYRPKR